MNQFEELLAKASACLEAASKIEDSVVRTQVLELIYQAQLLAQSAIVREIEEAWGTARSSVTSDPSTS